MLKANLPRVIYHQGYYHAKIRIRIDTGYEAVSSESMLASLRLTFGLVLVFVY